MNENSNNKKSKFKKILIFILTLATLIFFTDKFIDTFSEGKIDKFVDNFKNTTKDKKIYSFKSKEKNTDFEKAQNNYDLSTISSTTSGNVTEEIYNNIYDVNIDVPSAYIEVFEDDDISGGIYLKITSNELTNYIIDTSDNKLHVYFDKSFDIFSATLDDKIEILINPKISTQPINLEIGTASGRITIDEGNFDNLNLKTVSAVIDAEDLECNNLYLSSVSGHAKLQDINILEDTTISSVSSKIDLSNLKGDKITLSSTSGYIVSDELSGNTINSSTISGTHSLDFSKMLTTNIFISTVSGNIKCTFDSDQSLKNISDLNNVKGSFEFDNNSDNTILISTISGSVTID